MKSAEWICIRCGTTNRTPVDENDTSGTDRCITCHQKHNISRGERPVRWEAVAAK